jgi:3-methylfumaryl-CoA hydratase
MTTGSDGALDIAHLREWIGREDIGEDTITPDLARKYHAMFDYPGEPPAQGEGLPRLVHFCLAQPAAPTSSLGPDGHPARGGFLPPISLPRRMWAGSSLTFKGDLKVGDFVRRISRIADVVVKTGRTGTLCFVKVDHVVETNDVCVIEEQQDIVYRDIEAPGGSTKKPPVAELGQHQISMRAEPPLLFRYSALTFNSHRIHYDRRYVTEVEGYPGLVVHGPMQAALLCNYATKLYGVPPKRFSFRGLSPLFDDDDFALRATFDGGTLRLWTAKVDGTLCMSAEARWQ